jgi:LysR family glycine cleavage system transcriptional activator
VERLPLNALQVFVSAARAGNMTRAADRLHLTVSALSHQVRLLETRLGVSLFVRGPRGLRLTPAGTRLLERVAPHLDGIEAAVRPLCTRRDSVLSISVVPSMGTSWLVPRLPRFVAAHPGVEFNLDSSADLVDFGDGRFDGALRYGGGHWPGVEAELLFEEWLTPVASPRLLGGRRPRIEQLGDWPLLSPDDPWPRWFAQYGGSEPARYVATFSNTETLQRATLEGLGVSLGRVTMARPLIENGLLVQLFPERMKARYAHWLVYPERARAHAGFSAFRDWLLAEAAAFRASEAAAVPASGPPAPVRRRSAAGKPAAAPKRRPRGS